MLILLAVDGSEPAERAIDLVRSATWPDGTEIRVLSVVQPYVELGMGSVGGPPIGISPETVDQILAAAHTEAERVAKAATVRLRADGRSVHPSVIEGRPASAIIAQAESMKADLIVVGSHGRGAIGSAVLGSVSSEIVEGAHRPVLVARVPRVTGIVLADDGSAHASAARDLLVGWSVFRELPVRVVTVGEPPPTWYGWILPPSPGVLQEAAETSRAEAAAHADVAARSVAALKSAGYNASPDVRVGDAGSQIIEAARESSADLIVMGTRGRSGLDRLLLGSVARKVLHHAPCSVLVVHASAGPE